MQNMKEKNRTRVMIVVPQLYTGGAQKLAVEIATKLDKRRIDAIVLSLKPRSGQIFENEADELGVQVEYLHKRSSVDLQVILEIYRAIRRIKPDVIHANLRTVTYLLLPMLLAGVKKKYYAVHSLADKDAQGIDRFVLKLANRFCGLKFIAISEFCRKSIVHVYGVAEENVPCIYNGVDQSRFKLATPYANINDRRVVYISSGSFLPHKNKPMLLSAFEQVHRQIPETAMVFVGDGEQRTLVEAMVAEKGLEGAVRFTGDISDVASELHQAHIYVMASEFEGFPLALLEAMAAGLPVVTTKAGGVVDIVNDGVNGLLTEVGDEAALAKAMLTLARDRELYLRMAVAAGAEAQKYSIEDMSRQYEELYLS